MPNGPQQTWSDEPAAVYHSFDMSSKKAVWVVIKGNGVLRERIQAASEALAKARRASDEFGNALETAMVVLGWCEEGWGAVASVAKGRVQESVGYVQALMKIDQTGKEDKGQGEFRYDKLQEMSRLADLIGEMELILGLAARTVEDLGELYERVRQRHRGKDIATATTVFLTRVKEIVRSLETRRAQIASEGRRLENGRRLVSDTALGPCIRRATS